MFISVQKSECVTLCILLISRWIVQAMKHELKIRAGDMPTQDIYQLSPSDIKQLLLDVLQPQHTGRYSAKHTGTHTLIKNVICANLPLKTLCLYLNVFTCFIILLVLIILSLALSCLHPYLIIFCCCNPISPMGIIKGLSYLIQSNTH